MVSKKERDLKMLTDILDRGLLPDALIRLGIRRLDQKRLRIEKNSALKSRQDPTAKVIEMMDQSPIAAVPEKANEQHYEVPPPFFEKVLGRRLKYSSGYWPEGVTTLDQAEEAMLDLTCRRAGISDGQDILELGSGWGSLSLWMAQHYPASRIVTVSNSAVQRRYIVSKIAEYGIGNLQVLTADMNDFKSSSHFDRVVSVEMFEHMRNWRQLLARICGWLKPDGRLFVHIFTHRQFTYTFDHQNNWMGRYFFSGGIMPSDGLMRHFNDDLVIKKHWVVNGKHYERTAEAWLRNMDNHRKDIISIFQKVYGKASARSWFNRWRIFFMACAELWGYQHGNEWIVSHYSLQHANSAESETSIADAHTVLTK